MSTPWATGFCSAHQEPDPTCRICNPAVEELELAHQQLREARAGLDRAAAALRDVIEEISLIGAGWTRR